MLGSLIGDGDVLRRAGLGVHTLVLLTGYGHSITPFLSGFIWRVRMLAVLTPWSCWVDGMRGHRGRTESHARHTQG